MVGGDAPGMLFDDTVRVAIPPADVPLVPQPWLQLPWPVTGRISTSVNGRSRHPCAERNAWVYLHQLDDLRKSGLFVHNHRGALSSPAATKLIMQVRGVNSS